MTNDLSPSIPVGVELRVHGVSGTPPEDLLHCPDVRQVAGDKIAGFFRPRLAVDRWDGEVDLSGAPVDPPGPLLEGYSWGGLTSGAPTRALWLLLLPFTLINVAPRMRPVARGMSVLVWAWWLISRLLGITLTCLIVASASGLGMDLFGWQCRAGSEHDCRRASPSAVMHPLLNLSLDHRLAVGALVPLLVLIGLWQISGRTINSYESVTISDSGIASRPASNGGPDAVEPGLRSPWMWHNEFLVRRLRQLHLQAGFALVLWVASSPLAGNWREVRWALLAVAGYLVVMLCVPTYTGRTKSNRYFIIAVLIWLGLAVYAAVLSVDLLWRNPSVHQPSAAGLPAYDGTVTLILCMLLGLLGLFGILAVGLAVIGWRQGERLRPRALGNVTSIVFAILAVFFAAVFSAGVYVFAIGWLTLGTLRPNFHQLAANIQTFSVPGTVAAACTAYPFCIAGLVALIVLGCLAVVANRIIGMIRRRPALGLRTRREMEAAYPGYNLDNPANHERVTRIARTFWLARQVDYVHRYLVAVVAVGFIICGLFTWLLFQRHVDASMSGSNCLIRWYQHIDPRPGQVCYGSGRWHHTIWSGFASARSLEGTGAYLIVMTLVLLVVVGTAAFRVAATRKQVGILWDLASFWPRAVHPFAAACYAERTVPDLVTRTSWHARSGRRVVLAGHSQGTVISAATLFQLKGIDEAQAAAGQAATLPSVAFLSFGCVLRRLYARYFPAYFSSTELDMLRDEVLTSSDGTVRWRNLWRFSDYVGGPVMLDPPIDASESSPAESAIDVQFTDPAWDRAPGDTRWPAAHMHSDFWVDPEFQRQVRALQGML